MVKKGKNKGRTTPKKSRVVNQRKTPESIDPNVETVGVGISEVKEKSHCPHLENGIDLEKLSTKIGSWQPARCGDCREGRGGRGNGKNMKKKGGASAESRSNSKAIWVCLGCGHYACGGVGLPTTPRCHAFRHAKQTGHPLVIHFENPKLRWCFQCNTIIPVEKLKENGEHKDAFTDVVKLIVRCTSDSSAVNVEDGWFGSGSVMSEIKSITPLDKSSELDGHDYYVVKGLVNLGNTCFFNSTLQNLLAMKKLRDYFFKLDESVGPLTTALQQLFAETKNRKEEAHFKTVNVINPVSLLGCVCSKAPQFRGYQQHDSHELLRCLLDGLSAEELSLRKRMKSYEKNVISSNLGPTFVDTIFGGQVSSNVRCVECGHSSTVYEPFLDLSLPLPTKRLLSTKTQLASRTKKNKLPPKRVGKARRKVTKGANSIASSSTSSDISSQAMSGFVSSTPVNKVNDLGIQNFSGLQDCENKRACEDAAVQTSAASDDFTWLDFLEPGSASGELNLSSTNTDVAFIQDLESKDTFLNETLEQSHSKSVAVDVSYNPESGTIPEISSLNSLEEALPLQAQAYDVLLLPYKEENSTLEIEGEATSSNLGCAQDEFDGLGGLFDEPDVAAGPIARPSLDNEVSETGFMAGNSSESDPDEVDNTDSPVSIESCLAHYTKPEFLSNENAWHCENCSKAVLTQKLQVKKQLNSAPRRRISGHDPKFQSDQLSVDEQLPSEISNHSNGSVKSDAAPNNNGKLNCLSQTQKSNGYGEKYELSPIVSQQEGRKVEMNDATQMKSDSSGCFNTCQESFSDQAVNSCSVDERSSATCTPVRLQQCDSQLLAENHESEECIDDEIYSKNVKVKRDAIKRVLIDKAPHILTIHLKRFSQDARGRLSKLNGHVNFAERINLKPYMDPRY